MPDFRSILVGVDLSNSRENRTRPLDSAAENAVRHAVWLARASRATLTVISSLTGDSTGLWRLPASDAPIAEQSDGGGPDHVAQTALVRLVREVREQDVAAGAVVAHGEPWTAVVREVVHMKHDLVVVGTHDPHGLRRIFLGSKARDLVRACPCPVWVSKSAGQPTPRNILVASDLSPVSEQAVRFGLAIGHLAGAHTHILDVVEYPLDRLWNPSPAGTLNRQYHQHVRADADRALHAQLERTGTRPADPTVTVHVADGDGVPDHAIMKFIGDHHIDLLVLGTMGRHGLSEVLFGNTAERLLAEVPCSVLAVKPADFRTAVGASEQ